MGESPNACIERLEEEERPRDRVRAGPADVGPGADCESKAFSPVEADLAAASGSPSGAGRPSRGPVSTRRTNCFSDLQTVAGA